LPSFQNCQVVKGESLWVCKLLCEEHLAHFPEKVRIALMCTAKKPLLTAKRVKKRLAFCTKLRF
jgi:hypothetical protein